MTGGVEAVSLRCCSATSEASLQDSHVKIVRHAASFVHLKLLSA